MATFTQSDLTRYLARKSLKAVVQEASKNATQECDLHNDILAECRRRGWIALHGSMAHATNRTVGEPDFVILADSGKTLFVEAKARKEKPSPEQLALHAWAANLGHTVHVVRSFAEFLELLPSAEAQLL